MKKIIISFTCFLLVASTFSAFAQKKFNEGKITFEIAYPNSQFDAQTMAMLPTETVVYVKNDKMRMEQKMGMGMNSVTITDSKAKTAVTLMDMLGNKSAIKMKPEDIEKEQAKSSVKSVKVLDETKEVAGFKCNKAQLTDDKGNVTYVYYTKDIKGRSNKGEFKDIDGFPLEYDIQQPSMTLRFKAKKVEEQSVDDSYFAVPEGYKETTLDEFKKQMGGLK